MLNTTSRSAVNHSTFSSRFIKPLYDSYCFSNIPSTIDFLLTGQGKSGLPGDVLGSLPTHYDKVILLFVDAFGWRFFERYAGKYPFLKTILNNGVVSKLTSQFPSTTAAHVTCIHTGLPVGQSGVYEWNYYEPLVDDMITPLLFAYARDKGKDTLQQSGIAPDMLYPRQTFYQSLKAKGVVPYIFQHQSYTPSTYSNVVFQGANVVAYTSISDALSRLADTVVAHTSPPYYYFLYFDQIDAVGHRYGPKSQEFEQAVDRFFTLMDQVFYRKTSGKTKNTLLMITADHGQTEVNPNTTIYLNREFPRIEQYMQTNAKGNLLVPAGSARDMFLHIQEERKDEAVALLQKSLMGKAEVYTTQELLAQGFFGTQEPSSTLLKRVGNVIILPYEHETVWWYEEGKFTMNFFGHHGGLTPAEMEIPLLLLPL